MPVGLDMSVAESASMPLDPRVGKRGVDVNNGAYDMKSLGKHIEVVGVFFDVIFHFDLFIGTWIPYDEPHLMAREETDPTSVTRSLIVSYFATAIKHSGSDTKGDHALACELHVAACLEPARGVFVQA